MKIVAYLSCSAGRTHFTQTKNIQKGNLFLNEVNKVSGVEQQHLLCSWGPSRGGAVYHKKDTGARNTAQKSDTFIGQYVSF